MYWSNAPHKWHLRRTAWPTKDTKSSCPSENALPSHQHWIEVRQNSITGHPKYRISQLVSHSGQVGKIKPARHTQLKGEHEYHPRKREVNQNREKLLCRGKISWTGEPTYSETLHCSLVWLWTTGRHGQARRACSHHFRDEYWRKLQKRGENNGKRTTAEKTASGTKTPRRTTATTLRGSPRLDQHEQPTQKA